jgi:hypothetical protein
MVMVHNKDNNFVDKVQYIDEKTDIILEGQLLQIETNSGTNNHA